MSRLLGEARVAILADGSLLKPSVEAAVKKATTGVNGKVKLDLDTKTLDAQMAAEAAKIIAMQNRIAKARQVDSAQEARDIVSRTKMYAGMFDQISKAEEKEAKDRAGYANDLTRQLNVISRQQATASDAQLKSVQRIKDAQDKAWASYGRNLLANEKLEAARADELKHNADSLTTAFEKIKVRLDSKTAVADAVTLREKLQLVFKDITARVRVKAGDSSGVIGWFKGRFTKDVEDAAGGAGNSGGNSFFKSFAKSFTRSRLIAAAVIAGLAALPAAVGAVGVLSGIALGAGIMFGAEKLISSRLKTLTTQIKTLQTAMGGTPASASTIASQKLAVQGTQATIARLEATKTLTAAQQQQLNIAKQRLVIEQQTLAASQSKGQGTAAQQQQLKAAQAQVAALTQEKAAFNTVNAAMGRLKDAFLDFAVVASKPLIKPFSDALDYLSGQLRGPLSSEFANLFKAVGPLVKPVLVALLTLVKDVLPGMTDLLNKARKPLADLFTGFGRIVGVSLGQWFREAIPYIKTSSDYFLALVNILGHAGTFLIKFGGEFSKAFAGSQFKGFGSSIQGIANSILKLMIPAFQGWTAVMAPLARILIDILAPILRFLAANPVLTRTIFSLIAAFQIYTKTLIVVRSAMLLLGITTDAALGPWILLALAIGVAAYEIVTHWTPIAAFFTNIWKHIWSGFIGPLINFFTETIPHAFGVTLDWVKKNWPQIAELLLAPMTLGMSLLFGVVVKYHKQILAFITTTWGHIENAVTGVLKPLASVAESVWNQIYKVIKNAVNLIVTITRIEILIVVGIVGEAWRGIKNLTGLVWPWIYNTIKDTWGHIENFITGIVKPIVSAVTGAWNTVKAATKAAWDWIYATTKDAWGHIENAVTGAAKPTSTGVQTAWRNMKGWTSDAWNYILRVTEAFWGKIGPYVIRWAKEMVAAAIQDWKNLENWTNVAFQAVYRYIFNPLNKAAAWVENVFVRSIENSFRGLVSAVKTIWNGLKAAIGTPINVVIDIWNKFAGFIDAGLSVFNIKKALNNKVGHVGFAKGGKVPGYAPGSDTVPAMLSPGEYVINPKAVKAIGAKNLDRLNALDSHHPGQRINSNARSAFANGGDVVNDIEKWNGHRYIWGGGANPSTGWDCSSFVNYIVGHDFKLNLPGGGSWGSMTSNGAAHGPVAAAYNNWNYGHGVPWSAARKGDLAIENNGAHIGFIIQDNVNKSNTETLMGFAARSTATGTGYENFFPSAFHLERFADDRGFGSQVFDNTIGAVLKPLASLALNGIEGLANGALNHIPGGTFIPPLAKAAIGGIITAAKNKLTTNQSNYQFDAAATGPAGIGTSAGEIANGRQIYNYLLANLFGGHKIAAAGATASIWGESTWNPFAQGTGGRGLIGWTPASTISNADFNGGMRTQLPAILRFVVNSGDQGAIAKMFQSTSVTDAANLWGRDVERFGINDVHSEGIALATRFMANGGLIPGGHPVFDNGGTLAPGANMVYNLTGKPEALVRPGDGQNITVTMELGPNFKKQTGLSEQELADIRYTVRTKGGGNAQKAFGKPGA